MWKNKILRADFLLFLTAAIWGFAFVAQRVGMDYVGPYTFNGIRFLLGAVSLLPLYFIRQKNAKPKEENRKPLILGGIIAGLFLFGGSTFQQIGLVYTSAGSGGFITSLYVVLVPLIIWLIWRKSPSVNVWIGAVLATVGLYFLSDPQSLDFKLGDILVLISTIFWAGHVIVIGKYSSKVDALKLSIIQFLICGLLSMLGAVIQEKIVWESIYLALIPILYGGLGSVGIAYTLQVFAQKHAHPTHAAIILSFESVFAAIGGYIILNEIMGVNAFIGCFLMLVGVIIAQFKSFRK
ncbi:MAG: DMT family transporter [Bacteroidales bacterium]